VWGRARTFRVAVDRSWRRVTVDLTELARQHARLPCLSTFPHLREVVVTCNTRMQPSYWSSAPPPPCACAPAWHLLGCTHAPPELSEHGC